MLSKKTKYGIKALTFWLAKKIRPRCYCCYCKSENISVKFLESILLLLRHSGFVARKEKEVVII
jgi:DNA-binding IscR family transcriptional regulator